MKEKSTFLFLVARQMFRVIFKLFYRLDIKGTENIPEDAGAIIAPNHISFFDPPLASAAMERPLYFMAKKELFDIVILGWIIRRTNAFPVKRGAQDVNAIKYAFSLLKNRHLLLMFPEGTRSKNGKIIKAKVGAGMVACNAQVPLVPVKIENTNIMLKFKQVKIKFGKPIYPPKKFTKKDYIDMSCKVLHEISKM